MSSTPEERKNDREEQAIGDEVFRAVLAPSLAIMVAIVLFFTYISIERSVIPQSFLPGFLTVVIITILFIAYYMVVLIRRRVRV